MEGTQSTKMNIVYASDEMFAEVLSVSMELLLTNNEDITGIKKSVGHTKGWSGKENKEGHTRDGVEKKEK